MRARKDTVFDELNQYLISSHGLRAAGIRMGRLMCIWNDILVSFLPGNPTKMWRNLHITQGIIALGILRAHVRSAADREALPLGHVVRDLGADPRFADENLGRHSSADNLIPAIPFRLPVYLTSTNTSVPIFLLVAANVVNVEFSLANKNGPWRHAEASRVVIICKTNPNRQNNRPI